MEADIGTPIEYKPNDLPPPRDPRMDPFPEDDVEEEEQPRHVHHEEYYHQPPPPMMMMPPQMPPHMMPTHEKFDLSSIDKTTYVVVFAAFILGFFMGKTMQPVILRYS